MLRKDLARALGISGSMVSRLAKEGMPTGSVEAATRWRRMRLDPARVKGARIDQPLPVPRSIQAAAPAHPPAELAPTSAAARAIGADEASALGDEVHDALGTPAEAFAVRLLRHTLRAVPRAERSLVALSPEIWDALTTPHVSYNVQLPPGMGDEHERFWYAAATFEPGATLAAILEEM
jgi:hypothetical protein